MSPEMKLMMGRRESDDDGFTYVHGKHKAGRDKHTRNAGTVARCKRTDKRSVKALEIRRMLSEQEE